MPKAHNKSADAAIEPAAKTLGDLEPNSENPRHITPEKLSQLKKALAKFGDISGIVYNRKTKRLVGGHMRRRALPQDARVVIDKIYAEATAVGTVAEGHIDIGGERHSYREVVWSGAMEKAANLAANSSAGEFDLAGVARWMEDLKAVNFDLDLTMFDPIQLDMLRYELPSEPVIDKIEDGPAFQEPSEMGKAEGAYKDTQIDIETFDNLGAECPRCGFHFEPKAGQG